MFSTVITWINTQFVKRDALLEIEREVQLRWEKEHVFEKDAPQVWLNNLSPSPFLIIVCGGGKGLGPWS